MNDDESLRNCLIFSAIFHVALLLAMYFGLPSLFKPLPPPPRPLVPFEIVEVADITNTRIKEEPEETQKPPEHQPKPAPPVKAEEKPPEPPSKAEAKPPEPEAKPEELALPKPQQKPKPPEPPKPAAKPQEDALASVLKNVAKLKPAAKSEDAPKTDDKKPAAEPKSLAPSLSSRLTISEEDLLRRQIGQCWNMPVGARNAENLIVEVLIQVNPDRTVRDAQVVDQSRMASDPFFRAAGEAALLALRHPKCSPLELPADKYEEWKTIRFNFDPRDML